MTPPKASAPSGGIGLKDVLYALYRHKGKIVLLGLIGLAAAAYMYKKREPLFQSTSKLLVRYVVDRSPVDPYDTQTETGGPGGGSVLVIEQEIMTSRDVAVEVAEEIGAERLLPQATGPVTAEDAAGAVMEGLQVGLQMNVMHVSYSNPDPHLAQDVLGQVMDTYFKKHIEIRRRVESFDYIAKEADLAKGKLRETTDELNRMKLEFGVMSLERTIDAHETLKGEMRSELREAETELKLQTDRLARLEEEMARETAAAGGDPAMVVASDEDVSDLQRSREQLEAASKFAAIGERLDFLRRSRVELLARYTPSNNRVRSVMAQIQEVERERRELIQSNPELTLKATDGGESTRNPEIERARLAGMAKRVEVLEGQLGELETAFQKDYQTGVRIEELERRRSDELEKYNLLQKSLEKSRIDGALKSPDIPNISVLQRPTPPQKTYDELEQKIIYGLAGGGFVLGIGLALLLDLVLDRRIKRPVEIETRLQLPLLLSIPYFRESERGARLDLSGGGPELIGDSGPEDGGLIVADAKRKRSGKPNFMLPYAEAIRDRVIFNFAINNMTHKPKLIATAGLTEGAGSSTVAAGLAKAFAQTEGMKVLLVEMNSTTDGNIGRHAAFGSAVPYTLAGALQAAGSRDFRQNGQELYLASATARRNGNGSTSFAPKHLYDLMPHFRACDYDYIIFDMPVIDDTSPTLSMAGMMDKVLLVVDAENTSRDSLQRGYSELVKGRADVSCIFNKAPNNAPRWIAEEG